MNLDEVWLVGQQFGQTDCPYRRFDDVEQVKQAIAQSQPQGYTILVKGSNGMKLFQLPQLL
jgi:UDP-N-acetylmuramoyl-tripeptide--D-alanyl-D-alanine ligase